MTEEQSDVCYQQDDEESATPHGEEGTDNDACGEDDKEMLKAHGEGDADHAQSDISSWFGENNGQMPPDVVASHTETNDNDQSRDYTENEGVLIVRKVRKLESISEHPSSDPINAPIPEYPSNSPEPLPQDKLPPSERYKPRPPLNALPVRPSLTRASATYDSRPNDDLERKSSKRVSFQPAPTPLYTPPSTTTSSPDSPSDSPRLPFRTILSIPPGQYTPIASSSPVSPPHPPAARKPYTCLEPTCDSSFDHSYDRDRHERQHEIGNPPYSVCPICHHSRSNGAALDVDMREMLIAHINRRH